MYKTVRAGNQMISYTKIIIIKDALDITVKLVLMTQ